MHGHLYGTPAKPLESALADGLDVLLDIDTQGAAPAPRALPGGGARSSSWRPRWPSSSSACASAGPTRESEIARRLARARDEMAAWRQYDYLIVNRDVKEAIDQLASRSSRPSAAASSRLALKFPDLEVPN